MVSSIVEQTIISQSRGEKTFIPETSCKHGHWLRSTATGKCIECAKIGYSTVKSKARAKFRAQTRYNNMTDEQRKEFNAEHNAWRKKNPEKVHNWVTDWHRRNPDKMKVIRARCDAKKMKEKELYGGE